MENKKLNVCLIISFVLGIIYSVYIVMHFTGAIGGSSGAERIGAGVATAIVMPHMVCTVLATIFNGLGLLMHKRWFSLTGAILYAVAMVVFPLYFLFVIIQMILSFVGFAQQGKISSKVDEDAFEEN